MPNNAEHTGHTFQRYGVYAPDLHEWIDEPSQISGNHRKYRHNPDMEIPKCFAEKYGEELARNIILDHIYLDSLTESRADVPQSSEFYFPVDFLFDECPYEFHTQEWWEWHRWRREQENVDLIIKKHIDYLERDHPDKKIRANRRYASLYYYKELTVHARDFWEREIRKKIDEYLTLNKWEVLYSWQ